MEKELLEPLDMVKLNLSVHLHKKCGNKLLQTLRYNIRKSGFKKNERKPCGRKKGPREDFFSENKAAHDYPFYLFASTNQTNLSSAVCLHIRHGSRVSRHNHLQPRLLTHCGARGIRPESSSNDPPTLIKTKGFENLGFGPPAGEAGIWDLRFSTKYSCFGAPSPVNNSCTFVSLIRLINSCV